MDTSCTCRGRGRREGQAQDGRTGPLSGQGPLLPKVPAEQRDAELPQLPPLIHEAWLCVTPSGRELLPRLPCSFSSLTLKAALTGCTSSTCLLLGQPPGPPLVSARAWGLPTAAPPGPAALPHLSVLCSLQKNKRLYLVPAILIFPARGLTGGGEWEGGSPRDLPQTHVSLCPYVGVPPAALPGLGAATVSQRQDPAGEEHI